MKKEIIDHFYNNQLSTEKLTLMIENWLIDKGDFKEESKWAISIWMIALNEKAPFPIVPIESKSLEEVAPSQEDKIYGVEANGQLSNFAKNPKINFAKRMFRSRWPKTNIRQYVILFLAFLLFFIAIDKFTQQQINVSKVEEREKVAQNIDLITSEEILAINNEYNLIIEQYKKELTKGKIKSCEFKLSQDVTEYLARSTYKRMEEYLLYEHSYDLCNYHVIEEEKVKRVDKITKTRFLKDISYFNVREVFGKPNLHFLEGYYIVLHYNSNDFEVAMLFDNLDKSLVQITLSHNPRKVTTIK